MRGAALDHLVVAARTLDEGVAWCEAVLGATPDAGGRHALMSTHNRVLSIATAAFPQAYLEVIAIDPEAPQPGRVRWFDLDTAYMQAAIAREPTLVHWVLRCDDIDQRIARWHAAGIDRGDALAAARDTPGGMLRWRISVRADGARLFRGALPTLIAWDGRHPHEAMSPSGLQLESLHLAGLPEIVMPDVLVPGVVARDSAAPLSATPSVRADVWCSMHQ